MTVFVCLTLVRVGLGYGYTAARGDTGSRGSLPILKPLSYFFNGQSLVPVSLEDLPQVNNRKFLEFRFPQLTVDSFYIH